MALRGFDFNIQAPLQGVLFSPYTLDTATGAVTIPDLNPSEQVRFPGGATHFSLRSAFVNLDFSSGVSSVTYSDLAVLAIDSTIATQTITPNGAPDGSATQLYLLLIEFYQEMNGIQYPLKNGAFNVLNILEVVQN